MWPSRPIQSLDIQNFFPDPEDNEEFELLKKEEERVGQENREYAQEMQERDIAHQKVLTFRQHRDVADFEKGRKELLKREAAAAAAADVASVAKKEEERGADGGSKNFSTTPSAGTRVRGSAEGGEELRASSALTGDFLTNGGRSAVKAKVAFRKVGSVPSGEGSLVGSGDLGGTSPGQGSKRGAANLPGAREQRSRSRSPRREGSKKTTGLGGWGSDSDDD